VPLVAKYNTPADSVIVQLPKSTVVAFKVVNVPTAAEAPPIVVPSIAPLSMSTLVIFSLFASKAPPKVVAVRVVAFQVVNVPTAAEAPPIVVPSILPLLMSTLVIA
jgi:hypothetical protein